MGDVLIAVLAIILGIALFWVHNTVRGRKEEPLIDLNDPDELAIYAGEPAPDVQEQSYSN